MQPKRGSLRVYLGYAAGVGKTYQMLEDAQRLRAGGVDVVSGYFESHGRKDTIQRTEGLETIRRQKIVYRGSTFEEMDTQAIMERHPAVCVILLSTYQDQSDIAGAIAIMIVILVLGLVVDTIFTRVDTMIRRRRGMLDPAAG